MSSLLPIFDFSSPSLPPFTSLRLRERLQFLSTLDSRLSTISCLLKRLRKYYPGKHRIFNALSNLDPGGYPIVPKPCSFNGLERRNSHDTATSQSTPPTQVPPLHSPSRTALPRRSAPSRLPLSHPRQRLHL